MPAGEVLRDPTTGEVYVVEASWSGRTLDKWLAVRLRGAQYQLASAERMAKSSPSSTSTVETTPEKLK